MLLEPSSKCVFDARPPRDAGMTTRYKYLNTSKILPFPWFAAPCCRQRFVGLRCNLGIQADVEDILYHNVQVNRIMTSVVSLTHIPETCSSYSRGSLSAPCTQTKTTGISASTTALLSLRTLAAMHQGQKQGGKQKSKSILEFESWYVRKEW